MLLDPAAQSALYFMMFCIGSMLTFAHLWTAIRSLGQSQVTLFGPLVGAVALVMTVVVGLIPGSWSYRYVILGVLIIAAAYIILSSIFAVMYKFKPEEKLGDTASNAVLIFTASWILLSFLAFCTIIATLIF